MTTGTVQIATLIHNIEQVNEMLVQLLQSVGERNFNQSPGTGKWSIAQVADHIRLSNNSVAKALALKGKPVDRNPGERVGELQPPHRVPAADAPHGARVPHRSGLAHPRPPEPR